MNLVDLIAQTNAALQAVRQKGILLEAAVAETRVDFNRLEGRLAALQEIATMIEKEKENDKGC